jgi:lipoteichoic acid synthase
MDMVDKLSSNLPLFIINGGISNKDAWTGECNQLDVFTTILDILGIESQWRGLGHTLLNKNYKNSVTEKKQMMSEWIINSDYFSEKSP